jgi:peptidoglycan/xylan/chitin deacetylase (PgdA/CDA1 family)
MLASQQNVRSLALMPGFSLSKNRLTTILFHDFFFEGEADGYSRDRLKRQCEWLCRFFTPLTLTEAIAGLGADSSRRNPLMLTIDDAKTDLLKVLDIFDSFSIPVTIFACLGWCAQQENTFSSCDVALARLVTDIEWYRGPRTTIEIGRTHFLIGDPGQAASLIDDVLRRACSDELEVDELLRASDKLNEGLRSARHTCSLKELRDVQSLNVAIGAHSISHINLAKASNVRLDFEITKGRTILAQMVGGCDAFAYPYGMNGTFNSTTTRKIKEAGFSSAFLAHSDFAGSHTDYFHLPRISMPNRPMSRVEFYARAAGAGVIYRNLKHAFHLTDHTTPSPL